MHFEQRNQILIENSSVFNPILWFRLFTSYLFYNLYFWLRRQNTPTASPQRSQTPPPNGNECLGYNIKPSDAETQVLENVCTPSLPLLPGPLRALGNVEYSVNVLTLRSTQSFGKRRVLLQGHYFQVTSELWGMWSTLSMSLLSAPLRALGKVEYTYIAIITRSTQSFGERGVLFHCHDPQDHLL